MSVNKPNFPLTSQAGRSEEAQKELLSRLPKQAHVAGASATGLQHNITHASVGYQVTKTLTRQIAPAPGGQILSNIKPVAAHQVTGLTPAVHKKVTEIQKVPLSLTASTVVTTIPSNIIPVQISAGSTVVAPVTTALHVQNVSSMVRGGTAAMPGVVHQQFSHLPRGVVAASAQVRGGSTINIRQPLATTLQPAGPLAGLTSQIRNVINPHTLRPGTPPTANALQRTVTPVVSQQTIDAHRAASISLHNPATTSGAPSSIHITLQPSRTQPETVVGKSVTTFQTGKVHVNPGAALNMSTQPKVVMTQPMTNVLQQHQALTVKGRGPAIANPMSTVSSAVPTVTVPNMSTAAAIPIAKVPPQRLHQTQQQQQAAAVQSHIIASVPPAVSHPASDHRTGAESATPTAGYSTPQSAHSYSAPVSQVVASVSQTQTVPIVTQATAAGATGTGLFIQQYRAGTQIVTTVATATSAVTHTDSRAALMPAIQYPLPYMAAQDNPFFQQMLRTAVAQSNARPAQPLTTLREPAASLASPLQQAASLGANIRLQNPLMVMQDSARTNVPHTSGVGVTQSAQIPANIVEAVKTSTVQPTTLSSSTVAHPHQQQQQQQQQHLSQVPSTGGVNTAATIAAVSSLFTAAQTTHGVHVPQIFGQAAQQHQQQQQQQHSTAPAAQLPSSTPVNNPNSSPRPSILRKRTNEGVSAVKKQLAMTSVSESHSPRFETRPDSTPQSNMSSPKTPASGMLKSDSSIRGPRESPFSESQSSTDTALSSEATTPTQTQAELKTKHDHDIQENGYTNITPEASPRKRRKQLLQATEDLKDTPVNVFDKLVEACVKQEVMDEEEDLYDDDDDDDDDILSDSERQEIREEYTDDEGIRWTLEKQRPGIALLNFYNISWKPKNNHFVRYTDVKPKDERRPSVNELSNQKGVLQKASGWKLYHMAAQIEDLVELEKELNNKLSSLQAAVGPQPPIRHSMVEDESCMIHELTQGNIQRCKLLTDQLNDAKSQMLKVLDHKPKISEIVTKHMSKRPIKKKERT